MKCRCWTWPKWCWPPFPKNKPGHSRNQVRANRNSQTQPGPARRPHPPFGAPLPACAEGTEEGLYGRFSRQTDGLAVNRRWDSALVPFPPCARLRLCLCGVIVDLHGAFCYVERFTGTEAADLFAVHCNDPVRVPPRCGNGCTPLPSRSHAGVKFGPAGTPRNGVGDRRSRTLLYAPAGQRA